MLKNKGMSICRVSFAIATLQTDTFPFHSSLEIFESKNHKKVNPEIIRKKNSQSPRSTSFNTKKIMLSLSDCWVMVLITLDYINLPVPPCGAALYRKRHLTSPSPSKSSLLSMQQSINITN